MKINDETLQRTVKFEEIKIGEVFEWEEVFYLKVFKTTAFDVYNNLLENFEEEKRVIPRQSELRVF